MLVKWWLLALPQYLVVAVFAGGAWAAWTGIGSEWMWSSGGLIGLLVFFAGVVLLFTGRYPRALFDFVLGMNRWVFRVAAYASADDGYLPAVPARPGRHEPSTETRTLSQQTNPGYHTTPATVALPSWRARLASSK